MIEALKDLWNAAGLDIPLNEGSGMWKFWAGLEGYPTNYKQLGSPVGPEHEEEREDGNYTLQAFSSGIVEWGPGGGRIL